MRPTGQVHDDNPSVVVGGIIPHITEIQVLRHQSESILPSVRDDVGVVSVSPNRHP